MVIIEFLIKFLIKPAYRSIQKPTYDKVLLCISMCYKIVTDLYIFIQYSFLDSLKSFSF